MNDNEEWSEWFLHDGKGCPCEGSLVESEERCGRRDVHVALGVGPKHSIGNPSWDAWVHLPKPSDIIRYRIRKPRALRVLIQRARELDDAPEGPVRSPVSPKVPA